MRIRHSLLTAASSMLFGFALLVPASASATVEIQAHRGGPLIDGKAAFPENSLPGFEYSLSKGWTIELDLQSTSDHVAVVMHDEDLDRTTTCSGLVSDKTLAQLAGCRLDVLGIDDAAEPIANPTQSIPKLTDVISLLEKDDFGKANIEVKDLAGTFPQFPPDTYRQLEASDIPSGRITVQNFKPDSLTEAPALYPGVTTSYLTISFLNGSAISVAKDRGYDQVSPQWPVSAEFVAEAKQAGLTIAPFTLDDAASLEAADALGVDSVITNDPTLASRLVGPKPNLKLSVVREFKPNKARPGGTVRIGSFVFNVGGGKSEPGAKVSIKFNRKLLKPAGKTSKTVPALSAEAEFDTNFRLKVRRGVKRFGRVPVTLKLSGTGKPAVKKVVKVRILRPRK